MNRHGFLRITCVSPRVAVADPAANAAEIIRITNLAAESDLIVFPELCVTGYTCADLFGQSVLLQAARSAICQIARATTGRRQLVVVGAPIPLGNGLYNCAVVLSDGKILGIVPKQHLPTYKEYYESRWFQPANGTEPTEIELEGLRIAFGTDLLFEARTSGALCTDTLLIGIEICEDLWVPIPPSSLQALAGATVILNISASNETIGKSRYRTDLVVGQSGRAIAAYAMAGTAHRNRRPTWFSAAIA